MVLDASAKLCIFWYLALLGFFGLCLWRKFRFQKRPFLLNPWVFLSTLSLLTALLTSLMGIMLLPLALEFSAGIIVSFIHPIFAASFFLTTFLIKPWELLPPSDLMEILPRSLAALAFASLLAHLARERSSSLLMNSGVILFFAFIGWVFLSALTAYNSTDSIQAFSIALLPVIATFLLIVNSSAERLDLEIIRGGLVIAVLALSSVAYSNTLWQWWLDTSAPIPRLEGKGQWANANDLAALMVLALPLVFFPLLVRSKSLLNRLSGLSIVVYLLFGIWLSQSRGAILAIFLGVLAYILTSFKFRLRVAISVAVIALVPLFLFTFIKRESSDISGSNSMRVEYFMTGLRMLKTNPLTGVGFENYADLYERYTTRFDEYGKRTAHSSWVLAMAETGLPGLFLFLSLFLVVLRRAYQVRLQNPELFIAMVSYGTCMSLLSHTYQLAPYVLFAWILSTRRLLAPLPPQPLDSTLRSLHSTP